MSAFARPGLFRSTAEVAAALGDPGVRIVDCRFTFEGMGDAMYRAGHLPGAVRCDWSRDLSAPPPPSGHPRWMLLDAVGFAGAMARLGIGDDTTVIGYDAEGGHQAARLWLGLRRYGHDRCAVMEGGIQAWEREGRPLETQVSAPPPPTTFTPRPRDGVIASLEDVRAAVRAGDPWLLDVRRESEYTGAESRAKHGGHVPGAVHLPWNAALTPERLLRDPDELEALYASSGFGPETATVTYCQGGVRAAFTHLVLTALGHDDVRTYDGSWEEYGNRDDVPIVTGRS